jgi:hypothetical protein
MQSNTVGSVRMPAHESEPESSSERYTQTR